MFSKLIAKLTISALKRADLSLEDRNLLTVTLLDRLGALPLRDMLITNEEGNLLVNGRAVSSEGQRAIIESARGVIKNKALELVHTQVVYEAVVLGVHKLRTIEESIFYRAALWFAQQERQHLEALAQMPTEREPAP